MFNGTIVNNQYVVLSDRNNVYESSTIRKLRHLAMICDKYNISEKSKSYSLLQKVAKDKLGIDIVPMDSESYSEFKESKVMMQGFQVGFLANSTRMFPDRKYTYTKPDYEGMDRIILPRIMSDHFDKIRVNLTENPKMSEHIEQTISICDQIEKFQSCSFKQLNFITYCMTKGHPPKAKKND